MLKINNYEFEIKFSEINFRQRNYNGKSYITVNITTEFFPSLVKQNIVYGSVDIKIDLDGIHGIDELVSKSFKGDIGTINISVNNDGIWETNAIEDFTIQFLEREGRNLSFEIQGKDFIYNGSSRMVSLFTTSTSKEELGKKFNLKDFYEQSIEREIGKSIITKYFVK
ncbi:MAG: hypothetical protein HFG40_04120 [Bacilli bacterium]|nr:hypothetical protein [Bacilli bacterium]